MNKLGGFLIIMVIFMNAFGSVFQAIVKPETFELSYILKYLRNNIILPYWPIYGELKVLDEINNKTILYHSCSVNDESCIDFYSYGFIYFLFMIYMMIGNVLLLNLIIAMFRFENYFTEKHYTLKKSTNSL
jgi:hypothetical protein